jgi:hypothetical protein
MTRARGLVQTADPAPEINFPGGIQGGKGGVGCPRAHGSGRARITQKFVASAADFALIANVRNKLGPCLYGDGTGLLDTRNGNAKVVIVSQRRPNE